MDNWFHLNLGHLLVITEDITFADALQTALLQIGRPFQKAYSWEDAEYLLEYNKFDLAIVDSGYIKRYRSAFVQRLVSNRLFGILPWMAVLRDNRDLDPRDKPNGYAHASDLSLVVAEIRRLLTVQPYSDAGTETEVDSSISSSVSLATTVDVTDVSATRRLHEYQTLLSLTRLLNSTLDLNTVLTAVVDAATSLTHAEEGLLLLPDDEGKNLYIRAAKGIDHSTAQEFRIKTEDTIAGGVFTTGEPVLMGAAGPQKLKTAYYVKSLVYVPMWYKDTIIGVLGINNRETERTFTDHDLKLLEDLASHAAIAIENARLYTESMHRSHELSILLKGAQAVNSTLALKDVLTIIAQQLATALEVGWCEIAMLDKKQKILNKLISYRQAQWQKLKVSQPSALIHAVQTGQAMQFTLTNLHPYSDEAQYLTQNNAMSGLILPLSADTGVRGAFEFLAQDEYVRLDHLQLDWLRDEALKLLIMVEQASVYGREARQAAERLLQVIGAHYVSFYLYYPNQQQLYKHWSMGQMVWSPNSAPGVAIETTLYEVLQTGHPLKLHRSTQDPSHIQLRERFNARSLLIMPLAIAGELEGLVLLADTWQDRNFGPRTLTMADTLINQAANAIKNARLYSDLERSLKELRLTQNQLIQSARLSAMGEISAAIAHQINNPLTTVIADSQLLIQDRQADDPDYESLAAIHRAGKRAHEVVRRLLSMAHHSREEIEPQPMDVNQTIRDTLFLLTKHIQQHYIRLEIELAPDLPLARGLPGQLEDVWMNLILNARDAVIACDNPVIGLRSALNEPQNTVDVTVWDNGAGIDLAIQHRIFEAFYTTKAEGEGTGLGLHICNKIVQRCGGSIRLESSGPLGTVFVVALPIYGA